VIISKSYVGSSEKDIKIVGAAFESDIKYMELLKNLINNIKDDDVENINKTENLKFLYNIYKYYKNSTNPNDSNMCKDIADQYKIEYVKARIKENREFINSVKLFENYCHSMNFNFSDNYATFIKSNEKSDLFLLYTIREGVVDYIKVNQFILAYIYSINNFINRMKELYKILVEYSNTNEPSHVPIDYLNINYLNTDELNLAKKNMSLIMSDITNKISVIEKMDIDFLHIMSNVNNNIVNCGVIQEFSIKSYKQGTNNMINDIETIYTNINSIKKSNIFNSEYNINGLKEIIKLIKYYDTNKNHIINARINLTNNFYNFVEKVKDGDNNFMGECSLLLICIDIYTKPKMITLVKFMGMFFDYSHLMVVKIKNIIKQYNLNISPNLNILASDKDAVKNILIEVENLIRNVKNKYETNKPFLIGYLKQDYNFTNINANNLNYNDIDKQINNGILEKNTDCDFIKNLLEHYKEFINHNYDPAKYELNTLTTRVELTDDLETIQEEIIRNLRRLIKQNDKIIYDNNLDKPNINKVGRQATIDALFSLYKGVNNTHVDDNEDDGLAYKSWSQIDNKYTDDDEGPTYTIWPKIDESGKKMCIYFTNDENFNDIPDINGLVISSKGEKYSTIRKVLIDLKIPISRALDSKPVILTQKYYLRKAVDGQIKSYF
jgi:hypothetical protein